MSRLIYVILTVLAFAVMARADVYVLTETAEPTDNKIIVGGAGKSFPETEVETAIQEDGRVITLGFTAADGWVVSLVKGAEREKQHISLTPEWPGQWITAERETGYMIIALGRSAEDWCVVTGRRSDITEQMVISCSRDSITDVTREGYDKDMCITGLCFYGSDEAMVVMSRTDAGAFGQRYDSKSDWNRMQPIVEQYFANGYYITCISETSEQVGVVFNLPDEEDAPRQICVTNLLKALDYRNNRYVLTQIANGM